MQINANQNCRKYLNDILSTSSKCVIDLPTRITDHSKTLLGHIYMNDPKHPYTSGVFLSVYLVATFVCIFIEKSCVNTSEKYIIRDMRNISIQKSL